MEPRILYGLRTDISGNAHFISDTEILYPVGNALSIQNIPERRQKLIRLSDKQQINIVCVAPNRNYAALCEAGEKPTISIYDLHSLKKKKSIGIPYEAPDVKKFVCVDFAFDSKHIAAVTEGPDQTMLFYNWERGKVETSLKVGSPQSGLFCVDILSCNPSDGGIIALGGLYNFKFLTLSESFWRSYGFSKAENIPICSMAWLNTDRLLAGTTDGRILYMENGDLKNVYQMSQTTMMDLKAREEWALHGTASQTVLQAGDGELSREYEIRSLRATPRGFAFAYGRGTIIFFEKAGSHKYSKRNIYHVPPQVSKMNEPDLYRVNSIDFNMSVDRLIVSTGWPRLFYASLWGPDLSKDPEPAELQIMGESTHYGSIGGLTVCAWKPLFMTYGEIDRSIRLWNLETASLILLKQYQEDICCIALHPTGLFCLVGFTDKLRFMSILIDDTSVRQEFPIRNCENVTFSHGGHLFAAVNGNMVQVYFTIDFASRHYLKGHTGKVIAVKWSRTDAKLLTMGTEGAIYEWDLTSGQRVAEVIMKNITLKDMVLLSDESYYCIADDDCIREIKDGMVARELRLPNIRMHRIIIGKYDTFMVGTSSGGVILYFRCPLQDPVDYTDFHMHYTGVTQITFSYDERHLISAASDGSLCIWKLPHPESRVAKVDAEETYMKEILIVESELKEKLQTIEELRVTIKESETEHAYRMRQMEVQHNDKMRHVHRGYVEAIEELRNDIEELQEQRTNELNTINAEILKMKESHEEVMQKTEDDYEAKLIVEYDKYQKLEDYTNGMREDYEKRLAELEESKTKELKNTIAEYEARLHEKNLQLEEIQEEIAHQAQVHQGLIAAVEDDADREILQLRTNYEALLHEEKQANLKLKGEAGAMRNKYVAGQRDIDDAKRQMQYAQSQHAHFQKVIRDLEKDVSDLKKRISERDETIQEKEKSINDLRYTNQKLEKFKFKLNHKIDELKSQIDPRDRRIEELENKILDMENELMNLRKTNTSLELQLKELREKLKSSRTEVQKEIERNKHSQALLRRVRTDLFDTAGLVQDPGALKIAVMNLYHKYSATDDFLRSRMADLAMHCEFNKQREHLERTVASLKKQVLLDRATVSKHHFEKTMSENVDLLLELNALREELKKAQKHIADMESVLGVSGSGATQADVRLKLENACKGYEKVRTEFRIKMEECQHLVTVLKDDIKRLLSKLALEENVNDRMTF